MDWNKYGYVNSSKHRKRVVRSLSKSEKTPKEISVETNIYISHVSAVLKDLSQKDVVVCLSPNLRRGRIYALTDEGREIAKKILEKTNSSKSNE